MAYAFDKVDDYFRRNKQGYKGSLERGTTGAPPPTAAAEAVAKKGETSAEIGNADTSAFRGNRGASQTATTGALTNPAQRQATAWEQGEQAKAGEYRTAGEQKIGETYKEWTPETLTGIESGNQEAMQRGREQVGYTGTELAFQPYQVADANIDTTSMTRGGVGGLQAALQKNRGGRYTAGMGALDASLLAGNREAMQGLQTKLGDIYEGTRKTKQDLEQTDEQLTQKALEKGSGIASTVKGALGSRMGTLKELYGKKVADEAKRLEDQSRTSANAQDAMVSALMAQGLTGMQALDALGIGPNSADINQRAQLYMPQVTRDIFNQDRNLSRYVTSGPQKTYTMNPTQDYANVANVLGVNPETISATYGTYGIDQQLAQNRAAQLAKDYKYLTSITGVAPQKAVTAETVRYYDSDRDGSLSSEERAAADADGYDVSYGSADIDSGGDISVGDDRAAIEGMYRDYGTIDTSDTGDTMSSGSWDYSPGDDYGDSGW